MKHTHLSWVLAYGVEREEACENILIYLKCILNSEIYGYMKLYKKSIFVLENKGKPL